MRSCWTYNKNNIEEARLKQRKNKFLISVKGYVLNKNGRGFSWNKRNSFTPYFTNIYDKKLFKDLQCFIILISILES